MFIEDAADQVAAVVAMAQERGTIIEVTVRVDGELPPGALNYLRGFIDGTDAKPCAGLLRVYEDNTAYTTCHDVRVSAIAGITLEERDA